MVSLETVKKLLQQLPEIEELPHFDKTSFRVAKKIVATYDQSLNRLCIKLSEIDQNVFSSFDPTVFYPVPNKWGKQGWTFVSLATVDEGMLKDALTQAYCEVAPKKLAKLVKS
jgi:hypothetical protein